MYPAYDQIVSEAARLTIRSAGEFSAPLVVRMPCGGGIFGAQTHSQSPEALFTHVAGLKTVIPSNPHDAKGLLIAAIEDDDPVIFLEPKRIYNGPFDGHHDRPIMPWSKHELSETPDGHYTLPIGKAVIRREGTEVTMLAYGTMVHVAEAAVEETGIDAEIIDLSTLVPLDIDTIVRIGVEDRPLRRSCMKPPAPRASAPNSPRWSRNAASIIWRRRCVRVTGWDTPYPARAGMGLFPRPRPRRPGAPIQADGELRCRVKVVKLPDVGEGVAEAEIVEWHVAVGDDVKEDQILAAVMTDKATVEIPSPRAGVIVELGGDWARVLPLEALWSGSRFGADDDALPTGGKMLCGCRWRRVGNDAARSGSDVPDRSGSTP